MNFKKANNTNQGNILVKNEPVELIQECVRQWNNKGNWVEPVIQALPEFEWFIRPRLNHIKRIEFAEQRMPIHVVFDGQTAANIAMEADSPEAERDWDPEDIKSFDLIADANATGSEIFRSAVTQLQMIASYGFVDDVSKNAYFILGNQVNYTESGNACYVACMYYYWPGVVENYYNRKSRGALKPENSNVWCVGKYTPKHDKAQLESLEFLKKWFKKEITIAEDWDLQEKNTQNLKWFINVANSGKANIPKPITKAFEAALSEISNKTSELKWL